MGGFQKKESFMNHSLHNAIGNLQRLVYMGNARQECTIFDGQGEFNRSGSWLTLADIVKRKVVAVAYRGAMF